MDTGEPAHGHRIPGASRRRRVSSALFAVVAVLTVLAVLTVVTVVLPGLVVDHDLAGARIGVA